MLQEPAESAYDLHFQIFGYHVRVAWGFWVVAAILGWNWSQGLHQAAVVLGMDSPSAAILLLIWIAAIFVSILVHELGHALAFSRYGTHSRIVLYHFGGLAIPEGFGTWNAARSRNIGPQEQIVISAAGPGLQLVLAAVVIAIGVGLGIRVELFGSILGSEEFPGSAAIYGAFDALIYPSTFWALLNLAPILPLDGGQIMKNVLMLSNIQRPTHMAYVASIVVGGLLGFFFMSSGNTFAGIMFLMFAANNWQAMQYGSGGF